MPIHEKSLIRPENLRTHDELVIDGVDVSGHWSTFIQDRVLKDFNEDLEEEISALAGGEKIHLCWQCGSCTNACTVNAINQDFNPRYWIYLIRLGMESELARDKDIIWQCISCNKCTYACPKDLNPEGVMKATAHWLELKGLAPKSPSMMFDEVYAEQVIATGKIEEGRTFYQFFARTKQSLLQGWLVATVFGMFRGLPLVLMIKMGLAVLIRPRTKGWGAARRAIEDYVAEEKAKERKVMGLDGDKRETPPAAAE